MRKNVLLIAAAVLVFDGCLRETAEPSVLQDTDAIGFSAYTGTAVTKGVAVGSGEVYGSASKGIGVFAFYQPATSGSQVYFNTSKFTTPDFMCNQQVSSVNGNTWSYSPIKYWPNNSGDLLSFFAYAPYEEGTTWDDLGIATDATASKITASFPIYNEKDAMQDILWADPQINKTKASTVTGGINNPVTFNFKHILSKVAVYVGVEQNTATGSPTAWDDGNTTITIDKVEFTNLADAYNYSCPITSGSMGTAVWKAGSTTQDIVLSRTGGDFNDDNAVIDNQEPWTAAGYYDLLAKETGSSAFLFLAPQDFTDDNEKIIITYTVKTTASDKANGSTITNTVSTDLYDFLPAGFESGKAYTLKFLLGMNSVKITSTVDEWNTPTEHQIDVPSNATIQANTLDQAQKAVETGGGSNPTIKTLTVIVTEDAVKTATEDNVETVDSKNYLRFTLKESSPENVNFELPSLPTSIQGLGEIAGWLVDHETNYPTDTVTVSAPEGTTVIIDAPDSHVEVNGETYTKITASTGDNTLVIPAGVSADSLIMNKGGLEIHGTVTAARVSTSGEDKVYVRDCEGLSKDVYDFLAPYIDVDNCYVGEQESGKETYRIYKRIVAQIGDTKYSSLEKAFTVANQATEATTITMLADYQLAEGNAGVEVQNGKDITLDLNGKTVKNLVNADNHSRVVHVANGGTFTVNDSGSGGTITNELKSGTQCGHWNGRNWFTDVIQNEGTLVINGGTIKENYASASSTIAFAIDNNNNTGSAVTTINGGTVTNGRYAIRQFCQSETLSNSITVHGGTITGEKAAIWTQLTSGDAKVNKKADVVIDGGTLSGNTHGMLVESEGNNFGNVKVTISGGTFSGSAPVTICGGHLKVSGGTFNSGLRVSHYGRNEDGAAPASGVEFIRDYEVTGGTFNDSVYSFSTSTSEAETGDAAMKFLKGGTYSADPSTYVAYGYTATDDGNNTWTVEPAFIYDETDSKYHIYNLAGLKMFRDEVNANTTKPYIFETATVVLESDIDLKKDNWTPINCQQNGFGTFEGNNHKISNFVVPVENCIDKHAGLFSALGCGTVKNLTVDNATVTGINQVGAIVGYGICAKIENCTVKNSTVNAVVYNDDDGDKAGAICGYLSGEPAAYVTGCTVDNCAISAFRDCGGAVGMANGPATVQNNTIKNTKILYSNEPCSSATSANFAEVVGRQGKDKSGVGPTIDNNATSGNTVNGPSN